ncbi:hypothetical protein [Demequina sp.]|uniref:hypothetical protein n=1 Tax=Demequina sp. TaxID=2050685 RepID=UPI003D10749F
MGFLRSFKAAWAGDIDNLREGPMAFGAVGAPALDEVRAALEAGSITIADAELRAGEQADYFFWELASERGLPTARFEAWHADGPTPVTAALVGMGLTRDAWAVRTGVVARKVDDTVWESFFEGLNKAEDFLAEQVEAFPDSHLPWVPLIAVARGLQADVDEKIGRFEHASDRKPFDFYASEALMQGLAAKWTGDPDVSWAFARHVIESTAPRDPARAMLAHAAIESAKSGLEPKLSAAQYDELAHVFELFMRASNASPGPEEIQALSAFVVAVRPREAKTAQLTLEAIQRIAGRCGGYPWWMGDDPLNAFDFMMMQRGVEAQKALGKI